MLFESRWKGLNICIYWTALRSPHGSTRFIKDMTRDIILVRCHYPFGEISSKVDWWNLIQSGYPRPKHNDFHGLKGMHEVHQKSLYLHHVMVDESLEWKTQVKNCTIFTVPPLQTRQVSLIKFNHVYCLQTRKCSSLAITCKSTTTISHLSSWPCRPGKKLIIFLPLDWDRRMYWCDSFFT